MVTYQVWFKVVMEITTALGVSHSQIRSFFAAYEEQGTAFFQNAIDSAPNGAQAVLDGVNWRLEVSGGNGLWTVYPKPVVTVSVANHITKRQVKAFLRGFIDDAKAKLANLVASAPGGAEATVVDFHVHRLAANGTEQGGTDEAPT